MKEILSEVTQKNILDLAQLITNKLAYIIFVIILFFVLWKVIKYFMENIIRKKIDLTSFSFILTASKFIIICITLITALDSIGVKTTALLTSLGVAGLTIGFAAKDALSNLISGILIFIDRPFVLGDLVEIENTYGKVERITLRSTRIVTPDGKMLAVPNTQIINTTVVSYTNFPNLRLDLSFTVNSQYPPEKIRTLILDSFKNDQSFLLDPAPRVVLKNLNDYNNEFELQIWLKNEREHIAKKFELRENIFKILTQHNIDMPLETIRIIQD